MPHFPSPAVIVLIDLPRRNIFSTHGIFSINNPNQHRYHGLERSNYKLRPVKPAIGQRLTLQSYHRVVIREVI